MFPNFSKNFRYVWRVFHFSLWSSRPSQLPAEILHVYFLYAYDLSIVIRNGKIVWKRYIFVIFSLELRISRVAVQRIHQKSKKQWLLWEIAWWKRLWGCFSRCFSHVVMTMLPTFLRQFRRSLQIKKTITNAPRVL